MPETTIQKIRKGDKFFVNGEFNPNAARLITAAHDAYFWVDDNNMPHWTVDAEGIGILEETKKTLFSQRKEEK